MLQAEDGIRELVRSRGLGDVYKSQAGAGFAAGILDAPAGGAGSGMFSRRAIESSGCLLYTSDAADERSSVDLGGSRIIKKKK